MDPHREKSDEAESKDLAGHSVEPYPLAPNLEANHSKEKLLQELRKKLPCFAETHVLGKFQPLIRHNCSESGGSRLPLLSF